MARAQNGIKKLKRLLEEEYEEQFSAEQYMHMYTCAPRTPLTLSALQCILVLSQHGKGLIQGVTSRLLQPA